MTIHIDLFTLTLFYGITGTYVALIALVSVTRKHGSEDVGINMLASLMAGVFWPIALTSSLLAELP